MLKVIGKTLLGLLLTLGGIFLVFYYLMGMDKGVSPLLLIPAIPCIPFGVLLLSKAGMSDDSVVVGKIEDPVETTQNKKSILEKNNELSQEWSKTVEKRDKLKMLKISAAAQEDKT